MPRLPTIALLAALLVPLPAAAEGGALRLDPALDLGLTASATALTLILSGARFAPDRCRLCDAGGLDLAARDALRWDDPSRARAASDVLVRQVLPLGALLGTALAARAHGQPRAVLADALVVAEAVSVASLVNVAVKDLVGRRRPAAGPAQPGGQGSFYSAHTSLAFSIATATATVATLRGYEAAPWFWGVGLALASGVGFLRLAGDAHWASDVAAGAAVGGLIGVALPWLLHRPHGPRGRFRVEPAPGGLALRW